MRSCLPATSPIVFITPTLIQPTTPRMASAFAIWVRLACMVCVCVYVSVNDALEASFGQTYREVHTHGSVEGDATHSSRAGVAALGINTPRGGVGSRRLLQPGNRYQRNTIDHPR